METKPRIVRIVTQAEVVPWHLKNFIERSKDDYELYIIGNKVSRYKKDYPFVTFYDINIQRKISVLQDFKALLTIIKYIRIIKPKIIHSIMPKAGLLGPLAGFLTNVPIRIHTYTGQVWATKTGFARFSLKLIDKIIFKLCTVCLTDSKSQSEFLASNGFRVNGNPIQYLGKGSLSGVNLDKFDIGIVSKRDILRAQLGIQKNDFVYVFLARKSVVKGINELYESFAKIAHLPNVKLLFIGPDESNGRLAYLKQKFKNISDKIIELDIVSNHQDYLATSDILCLPSSSEGFGSIVIEAAALGVPSIGFDIVGLSDSIENQFSGILVPFGDTDLFSKAMFDFYNDPNKLQKFKQNAHQRVIDYFSADKVYEFQNQFYKSLLQYKKL